MNKKAIDLETPEITRKVNKHKAILTAAGYGIIVFILWNIIKGIIYLRYFLPENQEVSDLGYSIGYIVLVSVNTVICLVTAYYAGRIAKKDKKINAVFIVLTVLVLLVGCLTFGLDIATLCLLDKFSIISVFLFVADIIFFVFTIQIFVSAIVLKKIEKGQKDE